MSSAVRPVVLIIAALLGTAVPVPTAAQAPPFVKVIVVLEPGADDPAAAATSIARSHGGNVGFVYRHALRGFSLEVPEPALDALARHPGVVWVEPDVVVSIAQTTGQVVPTGIDRIDADINPPTVGLGPFGSPELAILDTGIMAGHTDLHVVAYTDCTSAIFYPTFGGCRADGNPWDEDGNGHGTHVAGIAAARDNALGVVGTAPDARLWSIKVLNSSGSGYLGGILAGIDLVTSQANAIKVVNMSLGFEGSSASLDTAIANSVNAGVVYVVAAGNSARDASTFSPASHPDVIAVSAVADFDGKPGGLAVATCRADQDDTLADFSSFGPVVDIAAPGVCILSTWNDGGYATASGTSMATPHVAGAMLRYIAEQGPFAQNRAGAEAARAGFFAAYTAPADGPVGFTGGSGEPMLYLGAGQPPPPEPNRPPLASFTSACTDLTCTFTATSSDPDGDLLTHSWAFGDGSTASGAQVTHTYASAGTYMVTLTSRDNELAEGTATVSVTVTAPPPPKTVYVDDLSGSTTKLKNQWTATVTITIRDNGGSTVAGAPVSGTWSGGFSGLASCTTGAAGTCSVTSGSISAKKPSVTFTVTSVSAAGATYNPSANVESSITINKP